MPSATLDWPQWLILGGALLGGAVMVWSDGRSRRGLLRRMKSVAVVATYCQACPNERLLADDKLRLRHYAQQRGWTICAELVEVDVRDCSRPTTQARPQLLEIIDRKDEIDLVIISSLATIGPHPCDIHDNARRLLSNQIGLCVAGSDLDCTTEAGFARLSAKLRACRPDLELGFTCH